MRFLSIAFALCAIGCTTPYQAKGMRGGYTDRDLGDGTYLITVNVNGYTSRAKAFEYFTRRAHDLCVQHGHNSFVTLENNGLDTKIVTGRIRCTG